MLKSALIRHINRTYPVLSVAFSPSSFNGVSTTVLIDRLESVEGTWFLKQVD